MSEKMFSVLQYLSDCKTAGYPFVALPTVHNVVLRCLSDDRGWIFESKGIDGTRYRITGEGEKALKVYSRPAKRYDGICPRCGVRPRHRYSTGRLYGFCHECEKKANRRGWKLKRQRQDPNALCSACRAM